MLSISARESSPVETVGFSRWPVECVAYAVVVALTVAMVWTMPVFPSQDGPMHLFNLAVLRDSLSSGARWESAYAVDLRLVPNLAFDLVALPLGSWLAPLRVEKAVVSLCVLSLSAAIPYYVASMGRRPFPISLFALPVLLNLSMMMGFYSFVLGTSGFFVAAGMIWRLQHRSPVVLLCAIYGAALVLFCAHLVALGCFGVTVIALLCSRRSASSRRVGVELLGMLPGVAALALFLLQRGGEMRFELTYLASPERAVALLVDLITHSSVSLSRWQLVSALLVSIVYGALLVPRVHRAMRGGWKSMAEPHRFVLLATSLLVGVYLLAPSNLFSTSGGGVFNPRFPWIVYLIALPSLRLPGGGQWRRLIRGGLIGLTIGAWAFDATCVAQASVAVQQSMVGAERLSCRPGDLLLGYRFATPHGYRANPLLHLGAHYSRVGGCVYVGNYNARVAASLFQVRAIHSEDGLPPLRAVEKGFDAIDWEHLAEIAYVVAPASDVPRLSSRFDPVWVGARAALLRSGSSR